MASRIARNILIATLFAAAAALAPQGGAPARAQTKVATPDILSGPAGSAASAPQRAPAVQGNRAVLPATNALPSSEGAVDRTRIAFIDELKVAGGAGQGGATQRVRGRFADVVRVSDARLRDQVAVEGSVRYEPLPGGQGTRAVVTWNQVLRLDESDRKKTLSSPLQSSFKPLDSVVGAGEAVTAQGDVGGAIAAAQALFEERKEENKATTNTQQPAQPGRTAAALNGSGPKNSLLSDPIKVPDGSGVTVQPKEDTYGTTTDGCPMQIDLAQNVAIVQSKITVNGAASGDCSPTDTRYPILRSYIGCTDVIDADAKVVHPQYRNYYMKDDGTTVYIGDACTEDTETGFALKEDASSCTTETNIADMKAYPRSELVYTNKQGQRIIVEACRRTPDATAFAMSYSIEGCGIRNDFAAGSSVQQRKIVYTDSEGALYQVSSCADSEDAADRYLHQKDYAACNPVVDMTTMQATPQYRIYIVPPAGKSYISECTPDPDGAVAVQETTEGCETVFFHDLPAGVSYGALRFRYQSGDAYVFVNDSCQKSTATYPHQYETQGYENHDAQLFAYPKVAVYIDAPSGRVDVSPALVRAGAPQLAYVLQGTADVPDTAKVTYQGCDKFTPTNTTETYQRPDGTNYSYVVGPGATQGPTNVCTTTVAETRLMPTGYRWIPDYPGQYCYSNDGTPSCDPLTVYAKYPYSEDVQKTQTKNMETGQIVSQSCKWMHGRWDFYKGAALEISGVAAYYSWERFAQPQYGPQVVQQLSVSPCPF